MFFFRKRQQEESNELPLEEKQDFSIIEKEIEVYVKSENEDINKKIYQKLMEEKNNSNLIK